MATPKLRFKEFEGDWSTNKIEEISIVTSGGTLVETLVIIGMAIFLGLQQAL